MPSANCVSRQELSDYCLGTLSPDRVEEVADHVERCPACDETLRQFEAQGDPMLSTVRSALSDEYLREPQLARVLQLAGANLAPTPGKDRIGHRSHHAERDAFHHAERDAYGGVMPTADFLDAGDRLRDYRLLAKLGEGGMGTVFEAVHTHLDKLVAIKILPGDRMRDPHCVARFQREMRAVGKLDHPNIVRALDAGEDRGRQYLVMELVDGLDLACVSNRRGSLAAADACELARQAALGLEYAHCHGLVHRDVKPSNLMLTADGQVKVLDLGLALLHDDAPGHELTATHQLMGTAEFMAPEQTGNSHAVDARADLYSLGCTLYKLLTGDSPFGGPAYATRLQKMLAHVQAPVPPLSAHRSDLPGELAAIVGRLLAKQPGDRYATGSELAAALAPFCAGADLPALFRAAWDATASQSVGKLGAAAQNASHSVETDPYLTRPAAGTDGDIEKGAGDLGLGAGDIKHAALPPSAVEADAALDAVLPGDDRSPHAPREAKHHAERDVYGSETSDAPIRRRPPGPRRLLALASAAALLAGIVFYVQTNHGTLRVEINDPQIEVAIKGDDITFKQADNGADVKLSPGEKTLVVERGDFKFETDKLVLKRGETMTVSVTVLPGEVQVKHGEIVIGHAKLRVDPNIAAADPDREVVNWVLSVGGKVISSKDFSGSAFAYPPLPASSDSAAEFAGLCISLSDRPITDADLRRFRSLSKPFSLELNRTNVTDTGLAELHALPTLHALTLVDTGITGVGIANLGPLPNLYALEIPGTSTTDDDLPFLSHFAKLDRVRLSNAHLTERGVTVLSTLPNITSLYASRIGEAECMRISKVKNLQDFCPEGKEFNDVCLAPLAKLTNLTYVRLLDTSVTNAGMYRLEQVCPGLIALELVDMPNLGDDACKSISRLTKLRRIVIRSTGITAAGVAELQAALPNCKIDWSPTLPPPTGDPNRDAAEWVLAVGGEVYVLPAGASNAIHVKQSSDLPDGPWQLQIVTLRGPWVQDDDFRRLANLQALHVIRAYDCTISGGAIAHLHGLPNLAAVGLHNSRVGDAGAALLNDFPTVTSIVLANTGTTDAGLEHIGRHRRLAGLYLGNNRGVTDKGIAHLRRLYALRDLDLGVTAITDAGLQHLRDLKQLRLLALQETDITDDGLEALVHLKNLKDLNLGGNVITDVGMPHIAKLTSLERLHLNGTHVGDDGVEQLQALTKLIELYLEHTELTDEGLKHLRALTSLKVLNVQGTQVTAGGVKELQAALPGCQIEWSDPAAEQ